MNYSIRETSKYTRQCAALGDIRRVDEALEGLIWKLATNPEVFDKVVIAPPTYLAKVDAYQWAGGAIPKLGVWFQIDVETVHLLSIKVYPDEDDNQ